MQMQGNWLFPTTPIASILKARPYAMFLFESFGMNPWTSPGLGIGELCAEYGVPWPAFKLALMGLEIPNPEADWSALPVYHLLDALTADHREFLERHVPAIGRVLSQDFDGDFESLQRLELVIAKWPGFVSTLAGHIREEEDVLFPRILGYHSCLRMGWGDPGFEGGSVRVFTALRLLDHDHRDLSLMQTFLDYAQPNLPGQAQASALEAALRPWLSRFHAHLARHARLEGEILFPMAMAMERKLYDRMIEGAPVSARR